MENCGRGQKFFPILHCFQSASLKTSLYVFPCNEIRLQEFLSLLLPSSVEKQNSKKKVEKPEGVKQMPRPSSYSQWTFDLCYAIELWVGNQNAGKVQNRTAGAICGTAAYRRRNALFDPFGVLFTWVLF